MDLLTLAGVGSALVALLHLVIIFVGSPAYRFFGAGDRMAFLADRGAPGPALITGVLVLIFASWAAYAFSGAGIIARLPALRQALVAIAASYTARGLVLLPQLWLTLGGDSGIPLRYLLFSAASLLIGLAYGLGTWRAWQALG